MKYNREYIVAKQVATYLRLQYTNVLFHFDLAGNNMSRTQAGMMKEIQGRRGYPDLFICEARGGYNGLFIELKKEGFEPFKKNQMLKSDPHLLEQYKVLNTLSSNGYFATFACGFEEAKTVIDNYFK